MKKILLFLLLVLSFFFPWISLSIIALAVFYLTWTYYSTSSHTSKIIENYRPEIISYFKQKLGNPYTHYNYINKNSLYFLYPSSSKTFSSLLRQILLLTVLINIVYFFKFDENNILFYIASVGLGILALYISNKFHKPISDYQSRKVSNHISPALRDGLEEYPNFFYHGEWKRIKENKKATSSIS